MVSSCSLYEQKRMVRCVAIAQRARRDRSFRFGKSIRMRQSWLNNIIVQVLGFGDFYLLQWKERMF